METLAVNIDDDRLSDFCVVNAKIGELICVAFNFEYSLCKAGDYSTYSQRIADFVNRLKHAF